MHFLPDLERIQPIPPLAGFSYEVVEENEILRFMGLEGLENAIVTDPHRPYQTVLAVIAKHNGKIVGMAGACNVCAAMWQIGIEVLLSIAKRIGVLSCKPFNV